MKIEPGKSYLWLSAIIIAFFFGSMVTSSVLFGNPFFGSLVMPICFALVLLTEIRSQVVLDGLWVANYKRGDMTYSVMIAIKAISIVLITAGCIFLIYKTTGGRG